MNFIITIIRQFTIIFQESQKLKQCNCLPTNDFCTKCRNFTHRIYKKCSACHGYFAEMIYCENCDDYILIKRRNNFHII